MTLGLIRFAAEDITLDDVTIPAATWSSSGSPPPTTTPAAFPSPNAWTWRAGTTPIWPSGTGPTTAWARPWPELELQVVLSRLLQRHPRLEPACRPADVPWRPSALRGPASLPVRARPARDDGPVRFRHPSAGSGMFRGACSPPFGVAWGAIVPSSAPAVRVGPCPGPCVDARPRRTRASP
ncbi:hypothetical protein ACRAWF_30610 [Streptomyces sp. L7]